MKRGQSLFYSHHHWLQDQRIEVNAVGVTDRVKVSAVDALEYVSFLILSTDLRKVNRSVFLEGKWRNLQ